MNLDSKIYIAGHKGLVGSAIWKQLENKGYTNLIGRSSKELDLTDSNAVAQFFETEKPEYVFLAAAKVGGIMANNTYRADFIYDNLQIQQNVIYNAYKHHTKKLLFLGSTCIYPKNANQPIAEEELLTNTLEYTNEPYAIAKIAGLKMCESYNLQYGTNYIAVMPTNLYGPNDNFHLENSHVMPAMMRKIYLAKLIHENDWNSIKQDLNLRPVVGVNGECDKDVILSTLEKYGISDNKVVLWGTGTPLREFLWSEDMADACVHLLLNVDFKDIIGIDKYSSVCYGSKADGIVDRNESVGRGGAIPSLGEIRNCHINIGIGKEITIKDLAFLVKKVVDFSGEICFDTSKPDGTPRKLISVEKLNALGWRHSVEIEEGVQRLFDWYKESLSKA